MITKEELITNKLEDIAESFQLLQKHCVQVLKLYKLLSKQKTDTLNQSIILVAFKFACDSLLLHDLMDEDVEDEDYSKN